MQTMAKFLFLDGNSMAYRAFFALPTSLATASGQVTNAAFGFTSMLINLLKDHKPDGIAVAFDRPERTFRHDLVPDYKLGRAEAPDILRQQMGLVRQVVETLEIPILEAPGYEADDVIATLATMARDRGDEVIVVTGDRDEFQLVEDPWVKVLYNLRGVSDYLLLDEAGVEARTGVRPVLYPQYAALRGDPSDNLPGVPGVGAKTAAKLINTYGDLDGVFANVDKNTPKLRESLKAHEDQVRRNATATPLVRDLPLDVDLDQLRMGGWDAEAVRNLFRFLEFNTLYPRLQEAVGHQAAPPPPAEALEAEVRRIADAAAAVELLDRLAANQEPVSLVAAWEDEEGRSPITGLAVALDETTAAWLPADVLSERTVTAALARLLGADGPPLEAHRAKELMRGLAHLPGGTAVDVLSLDVDTAIAAYLLDPAESRYLLNDLLVRYAALELPAAEAAAAGTLQLDLDEYAGGRTWQPITGFRCGIIGSGDVEVRYDSPISFGIPTARIVQ